MKRIVIFASGNGTNAERIITYFKNKGTAKVTHVLSNNSNALALQKAHRLKVKALHFDRESFYESNEVLHVIQDAAPDLIVLAGFLWKVPQQMIQAFPMAIINIHPALLPKFGGKGMYGAHVHRSVIDAKELESGITIHYVNAQYDQGAIIFQATTPVSPNDDAKSLAAKIQALEQQHFPEIINQLLQTKPMHQ